MLATNYTTLSFRQTFEKFPEYVVDPNIGATGSSWCLLVYSLAHTSATIAKCLVARLFWATASEQARYITLKGTKMQCIEIQARNFGCMDCIRQKIPF